MNLETRSTRVQYYFSSLASVQLEGHIPALETRRQVSERMQGMVFRSAMVCVHLRIVRSFTRKQRERFKGCAGWNKRYCDLRSESNEPFRLSILQQKTTTLTKGICQLVPNAAVEWVILNRANPSFAGPGRAVWDVGVGLVGYHLRKQGKTS